MSSGEGLKEILYSATDWNSVQAFPIMKELLLLSFFKSVWSLKMESVPETNQGILNFLLAPLPSASCSSNIALF